MYTTREKEKAIEHAEQKRRKRLDMKNERARTQRRINKFDLFLQSTIPTTTERKQVVFHQEKNANSVTHQQDEPVIYYDVHSVLDNDSNIENQHTNDCVTVSRMEEDDDHSNNYDLNMEVDEECMQSNNTDDQNQKLITSEKNIDDYKEQINYNDDKEKAGDIPFRRLYQQLLKQNQKENLISLLLHLDEVGLTKSTKLKLWLFSGSIIELPSKLRYRRYNMIPMSIWVGYTEPQPDIWLKSIVNELKYLKSQDIMVKDKKKNYNLKAYGITGDCPALKKILNFIGHGGYDCCWLCYIYGQHTNGKLQYSYQRQLKLRDTLTYLHESIEADQTKTRVNGHLGKSILQDLLDVKLPDSIVVDYMHTTLLGHNKAIFSAIYYKLTPLQRLVWNYQLKSQQFPHFFNRKVRPFTEFAHVKATELRSLLFYCLLPNLQTLLPLEKLAHLALYVCSIRLLHGQALFGDETGTIGDVLFSRFYEDHPQFYDALEIYVLHLHVHYSTIYKNHGSLANIGCFGQEDLIGNISINHHGSRYYGELITHYFNIDFSINNKKKPVTTVDGPKDIMDQYADQFEEADQCHSLVCHQCDQLNSCIAIYRRFIICQRVFHSLIYQKRQQSVSYFVQYLFNNDLKQRRFGMIKFFFIYRSQGYAAIEHYPIKLLYIMNITSTNQQRTQRKITKKKIFSPSTSDRSVLVYFDEDNQYKIFKSSDVISEKGGEVEIKNENKNFDDDEHDDEEEDSDEDEVILEQPFDLQLSSTNSFIQCPSKGFQTPAARRRNHVTMDGVASPIVSRRVFNSKISTCQASSDSTTHSNYYAKSSSENRRRETISTIVITIQVIIYGSRIILIDRSVNSAPTDDNCSIDTNMDSYMGRLQAAQEDQTSLIRTLKEEKNQELSFYRDVNDKENYTDPADYKGENLFNITSRDPADYTRNVLRRLFTSTELRESVLPSRHAHLFRKKTLDEEKFTLLNKAVRSQYCISKNFYPNFYSMMIQKTLSDCIYNEGTRRQSKQPMAQQQSSIQGGDAISRVTTGSEIFIPTTSPSALNG
ncbi:unnamed protein product [Rotaria socialis]|uniref:Uncharacterized protein n=3 Tax=Rotaria socialis TaxID=392032 RepID=A0A821RHZ1_9BILA|nr:unnamed protein product [Rotaria socialis]